MSPPEIHSILNTYCKKISNSPSQELQGFLPLIVYSDQSAPISISDFLQDLSQESASRGPPNTMFFVHLGLSEQVCDMQVVLQQAHEAKAE